ncbi:MAG: hypothetical protein ACRDT4_17535 [Micromonosporaceae bacterium]
MLHAIGEGTCLSSGTYRVLEVEIKQDLAFRPDPVAMKSSDPGYQTYYRASVSGCDNGWRTATYYGRTYFRNYTDYDDTSHKSYRVC